MDYCLSIRNMNWKCVIVAGLNIIKQRNQFPSILSSAHHVTWHGSLCPCWHFTVPQVLTENAHRAHGRLTLTAWTSYLPLGREPPNLPRRITEPHINKPKLDNNNYLGSSMPTLLTSCMQMCTWGHLGSSEALYFLSLLSPNLTAVSHPRQFWSRIKNYYPRQIKALKDSCIQELFKLDSKCVYSRHFVQKFKLGKVDKRVLLEMKVCQFICVWYTLLQRDPWNNFKQ